MGLAQQAQAAEEVEPGFHGWGCAEQDHPETFTEDENQQQNVEFKRQVDCGLLSVLLSCSILEEDSMNTMDIYNLYMDTKDLNLISPIHSPKSITVEPYFGTEQETEDVQRFWVKERPLVDAIVLVKELLFELCKLWSYKWPKELIPLYIEVFFQGKSIMSCF